MDLREISRGASALGRIVRTGRGAIDNGVRTFQVDPRRRDTDESRFISRDQRNWRTAEEEAYRREMLDRRAQQEGLDPRTQRGFREGGRGFQQGGFGQLPPGTIIGEDGSGWRMSQPGWVERNLFGAQPEPEQFAPPGTFAPGRAPFQQPSPFGDRGPQGRGQFPEGPPRGFAAPAPGQIRREDLPIDGTFRPGRETNPALDRELRRGREPMRHERLNFSEENVLEAFGRLNRQQQQAVVGALQQSGTMRGDPRDPQALAAGLTAGLRQNFPNINPATANPADLVNPLVDMPTQMAARGRDQQARGGRPAGAAPGAGPAPQAGAAPGRPATPPAPQMERGEHVAEFQRRAIAMNAENGQRLTQGLRAGSRPDDGIAGNNTEAVRREVITRLNADRGSNPEIPANTNLRDLNRIMEQRGIRAAQAPGAPEPRAAEAPRQPASPAAAAPEDVTPQQAAERMANWRAGVGDAQRAALATARATEADIAQASPELGRALRSAMDGNLSAEDRAALPAAVRQRLDAAQPHIDAFRQSNEAARAADTTLRESNLPMGPEREALTERVDAARLEATAHRARAANTVAGRPADRNVPQASARPNLNVREPDEATAPDTTEPARDSSSLPPHVAEQVASLSLPASITGGTAVDPDGVSQNNFAQAPRSLDMGGIVA